MIVRLAGRPIPADPRIVLGAVRAEATRLPRPLAMWFACLAALLLVGALGALRSLFPGDKGVATTPAFEWGVLIVGYVFFAITTSGLCLASSLGTVFGIERFRPLEKRHAILAVLCLVTAFGIIALDLHYPVRMVFGAMLNPSPSSPMWWMGVCYGFYLCVLLTEVWSMFTNHPLIHQIACTIAAVTAIVAPSTLGAVFGILASRPFWNGPFTPVLMVASAFLSGTALLGVVFYFVCRLRLAGCQRAAGLAIPSIRLLLTVGIAVVSLLVARHMAAGLVGTQPGLRDATLAVLAGPLAVQFWAIRVLGGLVAPLVILWLPWTRSPAGGAAASGLALVGVFADRLTFVTAGQIAPTTAASGIVSTPYATYSPSAVEISILIGAVAFVAFAYTLAERYLDLAEADSHFVSLRPAWLRWGRPTIGAEAAAMAVHSPKLASSAGDPAGDPAGDRNEPADTGAPEPGAAGEVGETLADVGGDDKALDEGESAADPDADPADETAGPMAEPAQAAPESGGGAA